MKVKKVPARRALALCEFPVENEQAAIGAAVDVPGNEIAMGQPKGDGACAGASLCFQQRPAVTIAPTRLEIRFDGRKTLRHRLPHRTFAQRARPRRRRVHVLEKCAMGGAELFWRLP